MYILTCKMQCDHGHKVYVLLQMKNVNTVLLIVTDSRPENVL